jgi:general secretion pathway protein D
MLGGLISDDRTTGDRGIPWLKNIPILGQLFRVNNDNAARTELIVLITPYVVNDGSDARHYTEELKAMLPLLQPQFQVPTKGVTKQFITPKVGTSSAETSSTVPPAPPSDVPIPAEQ